MANRLFKECPAYERLGKGGSIPRPERRVCWMAQLPHVANTDVRRWEPKLQPQESGTQRGPSGAGSAHCGRICICLAVHRPTGSIAREILAQIHLSTNATYPGVVINSGSILSLPECPDLGATVMTNH